MKSQIKCGLILLVFINSIWTKCIVVQASSYDSVLKEKEFETLYDSVDELSNGRFDFFDYIDGMIRGNERLDISQILNDIFDGVKGEFSHLKNVMVYIIALGVISGVATNFTGIFENGQSKNLSFYIMYILMITTLVSVFKEASVIAQNIVNAVNDFMTSLIPAYFMTVALTGKVSTSVVFYQFILILIKISDLIFINVLLPLVNVYVILILVNNLAKEDYLSKMAELIKDVVEWILKALMAVVIGFNVIRGLIMPAVDSFKMTGLNKTISAIPGIGNTANAISEMLIGSAVIIKNGVGVTALICLLVITGIPLIKIGLYMLIYKVTSALIQPIADKRLVESVEYVANGCRLLFKVAINSVTIFMLAIAIVTAIT